MYNRRLKKLILLRLLAAALLCFITSLYPSWIQVFLYMGALSMAGLSFVYLLWYFSGRYFRQLAYVQIVSDILVFCYLVFWTGGAESPLGVLFPLTILSVALVVGEKKAVIAVSVLSCLGYLLSAYLASKAGVVATAAIPEDRIYFFYGVSLRVIIFLMIGYLSLRLSGAVTELQGRVLLVERLSSLGEVMSRIAHEIKNPLSSIRMASEVLIDALSQKLNEKELRMLQLIDGESGRLVKTMQRILGYVKQTHPDPRLLELDTLVEHTFSILRLNPEISFDTIRTEKKYNQSTKVYADEEQILSVLSNLFLNACQAMPRGGPLSVTATENWKGTTLEISDKGGGISTAQMETLFTPFKSSKKGGTGLGLADVHKIVTLHEGKIEVQSENNKGTKFKLFFPKP